MTTEIQTQVQAEVTPLVAEARALKITNQDERNFALEMIKKVRRTWKAVDERLGLTEAKEAAHAAKVATLNTYNSAKEQFEQAETILNSNIRNFDLAEKRRRDEEARRLEAERKEQEKIEKDKLLEQAAQSEKEGNTETAQVLLDQAENHIAAPAFQAPSAPPVEGTSSKVVWKAEVINTQDVCRLIAEGELSPNLVSFNKTELNNLAKQWGGVKEIKGIKFSEDIQLRIRA